LTAFYEVRHTLATASNGKDTLFEGCARRHDLGTVPPNSGQRLKNRASAKLGTHGSAVSQWCNRLYRAEIP
jgi:hypothetical protein